MRNILYSFLFLTIFFLGISSCSDSGFSNFLEQTVTSDLDIDKVFSDSAFTEGFLTGVYENIGFDVKLNRFQPTYLFAPQAGGLQTACDEFQFKVINDITTDVLFATGAVNPVVISDDAFRIPYENIRKVNIFLANVDRSPLSDRLKKTYKAEARFLRAWYYFVMVKHYGGIPLIGDVIYKDNDVINTKRNTFEECVDYIVNECDSAANYLTIKPVGRYNGRVGKGACYALISRVKLYAASPLFNGSKFGNDVGFPYELVGYKEPDKKRWKDAMEAAERVNSLGAYSLYVNNKPIAGEGWYMSFFASDIQLFIDDKMCASNSPSSLLYSGAILDHKKMEGNQRENLFFPLSRSSGGGGYPYQEFVDMFPMKNGKAIKEGGSGYDPTDPFVNRDPRFKNCLRCDLDSVWVFRGHANEGLEEISIYIVRETGLPATIDGYGSGTPTGFYNYKMLSRKVDGGNNFTYHSQSMPLMRYAEILLNYAEAANEYYDSPPERVYDALKMIRNAAGIEAGTDALYGFKPDMTQDEMREVIRHERRIELALEGHRFFDVRRWMIAEQTDNKWMHGVKVIRNLDRTDPVYVFDNPVREHIFRKQYYFWPLPDKEVKKSKDMLQNPYY